MMPTIRRFNQTPPDRANELFEKLLGTTDGAVKTRERMFSELKEELELLATLQEQHLFPILRKHQMQDLVEAATADNRETRALLAAIELMPKDGQEFLSKINELRDAFQRHIRDDKKELLPAVLKVLSDEEAEAVVEQVEDEMANLDEMKRGDSRRAREQVEAVQRVTEGIAETARAGAESVQTVAQTMQEAVANSFTAFSELARHSTGQAMQVFARPDGDAGGVTEQASQDMRAVAQSSAALARAAHDVTQECFQLSQKRWQSNLEGMRQLAQCRTWADVVAVQSSLLRSNLEQTLDNSRRLAELTVQAADEATRTVTVEVEKRFPQTNRASRAA